ncbi:MAG: hypothetical protein ACREH3_12560, partial [Geminicoccales bacterium]
MFIELATRDFQPDASGLRPIPTASVINRDPTVIAGLAHAARSFRSGIDGEGEIPRTTRVTGSDTDPMKSRPMGRCAFSVMPRLDRGIQTG